MARGPKKHQKRISAPKAWMLSKVEGIYATRPSQGPHKLRESIPLSIILKNKLQYATNGTEVIKILQDKDINIRIDGQPRRDRGFPVGFMDVITIEKSGESYRVLYDVKGRFAIKKISKAEAQFKLLKITAKSMGPNKIPYITGHDAKTLRFPHPDININDSVVFNIESQKVTDCIKLETGNVAMIKGGNNIGRVGVIEKIERHLGSIDIVHLKDSNGKQFATKITNVFAIGKGKKPIIEIPRGNGLYYTALEEKKRKDSNL